MLNDALSTTSPRARRVWGPSGSDDSPAPRRGDWRSAEVGGDASSTRTSYR